MAHFAQLIRTAARHVFMVLPLTGPCQSGSGASGINAIYRVARRLGSRPERQGDAKTERLIS
jgi:hypothetical protein